MTREEAIEILAEIQTQHKKYIGQTECNNALNMAIEALKAEPVKHGEWITDKDGYPHCSECGFSYGCIECCHDEDTYFCPNCGSAMTKEKEK